MSVDLLQEKIRKLKNPAMVDFTVTSEHIPGHLIREEGSFPLAYARFCRELMAGLKDLVPAVRFSFDAFALLGAAGLEVLSGLLKTAGEMGFYVLLDSPQILTPWNAQAATKHLMEEDVFYCDGLLISPYIGSDAIKPFVSACKERKKALFVTVRSPNKSAAELQDLMTGSRLVQGAAAELVSRFAGQENGKYGYSSIAAASSAGAPQSLQTLRKKYSRMFLLVDGLDYPSGNAKNCSYAFDRFGYGAVVCAGPSVVAAWMEGDSDGSDFVALARQSAERMKKNLTRYFTIL